MKTDGAGRGSLHQWPLADVPKILGMRLVEPVNPVDQSA
jgi:hypothetical protein